MSGRRTDAAARKIAAPARKLPRAALAPILDRLRAEPSRTWSIIVTVYGDAIVPRGGCVWLGTLLAFFKALGIAEGVVRTAMSRLAADGWLERRKAGRNSFYALADKGRDTFAAATRHIYAVSPPAFPGHLDLVLLANGPGREAARAALEAAGWGSPAPGVFVAPGWPLPAAAGDELAVRATGDDAALRDLAARAWPLDATADAYHGFLDTFAPLRAALANGAVPDEAEAIIARVLLIHEYRRIVLRDPLLPAALLPQDWPGAAARTLCAALYRDLLEPSERWLDAHAIDEAGAPLRRGKDVLQRFHA
ncbi:phenylacetic acid degradation operon negative regulatory protein PaaX [Rhodoplanes elegans]|uniref:Phenylacetic acid degradation operon negative regulatory protein PaaX n=1 Tax=Rhodoplanes elegans TaxID=29408 RepID=A0A327KQN5_9BRAD|nr:phenylacetic acid degradation operon negative regulatory protein PaaX [Rhodoplanes elegans]MBK5958670.1 phenylacetic acid degradation operon negative regulatory protein PaaX [Rhodoplanes elegans]RAI40226.1 phenylacetic acid degradation operon negative regulatory protein PaaX [Rhodoplanes elegans]